MPPIFGPGYYNDTYGRTTSPYAGLTHGAYPGSGDYKGANRWYGRIQKGMGAQYARWYNEADQQAAYDPDAIQDNAEGIRKDTFFLKRMFGIEQERLPEILSAEPTKVDQTIEYFEQQGDRDPLGQFQNFWHWGSARQKHTANLDQLADNAVETQNAHQAALSILKACDGWNIAQNDDAIIDKILIKSKEKMSPEEYNLFIRNTAIAVKNITGGNSLNNILRERNAVYGIHISALHWNPFGTRKKGTKYENVVTKAINTHQPINTPGFMGMPFMPRMMSTA